MLLSLTYRRYSDGNSGRLILVTVYTRVTAAFGAPNGFKNFCRAMRIPNMCLVLKLDDGEVVSIADEKTDGQSNPVPY